EQPQAINALTIGCIAIVAYFIAIPIIHEGMGHGLTALALGASDVRLTSTALFFDADSVSTQAIRIINIAGPLASLLGGLLLALAYRTMPSRDPELLYFLWLTAFVCLFQGGGYFMALSFVQFGDIHHFVKGLEFEFAWRLGLTV